MLILIGTVPTAYALNHAVGADQAQVFVSASQRAADILAQHGGDQNVADPRAAVTAALRTRTVTPESVSGLHQLIGSISNDVSTYGALAKMPFDQTKNIRNDMYLSSELLNLMKKSDQPQFSAVEQNDLKSYKGVLDNATKFIPSWVKVAVALALGIGTMIGWKRIVVTVGERIGKTHLTYGQGASAEIVAMGTIMAADAWGLPVSTTHILSSGVAGTMVANGSGLQWSTIRSIASAWILTLPAAIVISGTLYWVFRSTF
jgi:PiT family inorganic phosphate transporter